MNVIYATASGFIYSFIHICHDLSPLEYKDDDYYHIQQEYPVDL